MSREILKPLISRNNLTVGVFTPSFPAHLVLPDKYRLGLSNLERAGFGVVEGDLTRSLNTEGYRTASGQQRAKEIMDLICDDKVDILMSNIGGYNTSSLLPYLDFEKIREKRKLIVGYSDVTSLHMAILTKAGLSTCYGPAVTPSFGEWPKPDQTLFYFTNLLNNVKGDLKAPALWSNDFRGYRDGSWCKGERKYLPNEGWRSIHEGEIEGDLVIANLSTLLSIAGTPYFPSLKGKILVLEDADSTISMFERRINQLKLIGVLGEVVGLLLSKHEFPDPEFGFVGYDKILSEFCHEYAYPLVSNFDCGHATPIISLMQNLRVRLKAGTAVSLEILGDQVEYR